MEKAFAYIWSHEVAIHCYNYIIVKGIDDKT